MVLSAGSVSAAQGYGGNSFWYFQRQVRRTRSSGSAPRCSWRGCRRACGRRLGLPLLGVATLLMAIAAHPSSGTSLYGASRWIDLGPVTLQPSEFAKLGLVAVTATVLTNKWNRLDEPLQLVFPLGLDRRRWSGCSGSRSATSGTTLILCGVVLDHAVRRGRAPALPG